ncbi:MAG: hypothetical protein IJX51_00350 [Clostridia bacterium]|nr:hypothetical protein [Clostridia bacterium]
MKKICIASKDNRFIYAKELFDKNGYLCKICDIEDVDYPDALVLSPRLEHDDANLRCLAARVRDDTVIFTGQGEKIKAYFKGRVIDYSENESYLLKNAYITAQCAIKLTYERLTSPVYGKRALVIGYGRIGKYLASTLKSLGAVVFVYARREESRVDAALNGMGILAELSLKTAESLDLVYNTVPYRIVDKSVSNGFKGDAFVMELASAPGGFEDDGIAVRAPALPGRMMPEEAGKAIFDLIDSYLCLNMKGK